MFELKISETPDDKERMLFQVMLEKAQTELAGLEGIWRLSWPELPLHPTLGAEIEHLLDHAVTAHGADFGSCQIWNDGDQSLALMAQTNFDGTFGHRFAKVRDGDGTICETAMKRLEPVSVVDLEEGHDYASLRIWARTEGVRSVTSVPLIERAGKCIGVYSVHYRNPHPASSSDPMLVNAYRARFADILSQVLNP
jgi:GAF domain-containing protein